MKHEITVPEVGESISEVVIAEWLIADGDYVAKDKAICEIESDKASFEVPADEAGVIEHKAEEGDTVAVGAVLALVDTEAEKPESETESAEDEQEEKSGEKIESSEEETERKEKEPTKEEEIKISPVASNILEEAGISPGDVTGTGVDGKITKSDAQKAVDAAKESKEEKPQKKEPAKAKTSQPRPPQLTGERETEKSRMSTLRKTIAGRLVSAQNETAMLTTFNEIDLNAVMEVRKQFKEPFEEKYGVRLGFMSFFAKACSVAFNDFPIVNAKLEDDHIIYHNYADIGVAVSTDRGLVVPVVKNADQMSFAQLEETVYDLAVRARDNELSINEMRGGTFTITNGGVFGSLLSTPIINSPQSAILGMHKIEQRPIALNGEVVIRPMMYVALSYDHRIIDGKDSVQFLVRVKELLENPSRMLLEV